MSINQTIPESFLNSSMSELHEYGIPEQAIWALEKAYGLWISGLKGVDLLKLRSTPHIRYEMALRIKKALVQLYNDKTAPIIPIDSTDP